MLKKCLYVLLVAIGLLSFSLRDACAFTITVDGRLDEWGVTPGYYGASTWTPYSGINYAIEDTAPGVNEVGPGFGGQQFDVEAMYLTSDATNIYYAIVTGFPFGGAEGYVAGDIGFDIGANNSYDYGISVLNRNGLTAGTLYKTNSWANGLWSIKDPLSNPTYITSTDSSFTPIPGELIYNQLWVGLGGGGSPYYNGDHYVIEGYLPNVYAGDLVRMHWAMSCSNDYLNLDVTPTPEPTTLSLLGLGLLGLAGLRKRRIK